MKMAQLAARENIKFLSSKAAQIAEFLEEFSTLANCHTVHFITQDYWNNLIKSNIQSELLQLSLDELAKLPCGHILNDDGILQISEELVKLFLCVLNCWSCELDLLSLKQQAQDLYPDSHLKQHMWLARQHTLPFLGAITTNIILNKERISLRNFMSSKKSHEVAIMAELVNDFARDGNISQVVDIGSGKGYLSSVLAVRYKFLVLGIDSSSTNTQSAVVRNSRILKHWREFDNFENSSSKNKKEKFTAENKSVSNENINEDDQACSDRVDYIASTKRANKGKYLPVTQFVNSSTDLNKLLQANGFSTESYVITGLHTCGNLSSSVIELFLSNSKAKVLCNVGCCYNHIEEEFCRSPFWKEGDPVPSEFGFPLSSFFRLQKVILGRNARMLASLPPDRMAAEKKNFSSALFYRALLQVIFHDKLGDDSNQFQVGKLAPKCQNFVEYVLKAEKKLNLNLKLSPEEIVNYFHSYSDYEKKMNAFFYFRASLASCIESLVLLDRLCYLLEQEAVDSAHIIPMFDPTKSPRCYGLIALKK